MSDSVSSQETILSIPSDISDDLVPIAREVHRLHEAALWSAQGQFEQTKVWRLMNMVLGVPAASLAALAGGTGLAADHKLSSTAILALVAAGFSAALTTLNPSRRITQSQAAANAYLGIQTDARQLLTIDILRLPYDEVREHLSELTARRDEVNRTADPPSRWARRRASKSVRSGGQAYEIDKKRN